MALSSEGVPNPEQVTANNGGPSGRTAALAPAAKRAGPRTGDADTHRRCLLAATAL